MNNNTITLPSPPAGMSPHRPIRSAGAAQRSEGQGGNQYHYQLRRIGGLSSDEGMAGAAVPPLSSISGHNRPKTISGGGGKNLKSSHITTFHVTYSGGRSEEDEERDDQQRAAAVPQSSSLRGTKKKTTTTTTGAFTPSSPVQYVQTTPTMNSPHHPQHASIHPLLSGKIQQSVERDANVSVSSGGGGRPPVAPYEYHTPFHHDGSTREDANLVAQWTAKHSVKLKDTLTALLQEKDPPPPSSPRIGLGASSSASSSSPPTSTLSTAIQRTERRSARAVHALRILGDNMTIYKSVFDALAEEVTFFASEYTQLAQIHSTIQFDHEAQLKAKDTAHELATIELSNEVRLLKRQIAETAEAAEAVKVQQAAIEKRSAELENTRLANAKQEEEIANARRTQDVLFTQFAVRNKNLQEEIDNTMKNTLETQRRADELNGTCQRYAQRVYKLEQLAIETNRQHESTVKSITNALKAAQEEAKWLMTSLQSLRTLKHSVDDELTETKRRLDEALDIIAENRRTSTPRPVFRFVPPPPHSIAPKGSSVGGGGEVTTPKATNSNGKLIGNNANKKNVAKQRLVEIIGNPSSPRTTTAIRSSPSSSLAVSPSTTSLNDIVGASDAAGSKQQKADGLNSPAIVSPNRSRASSTNKNSRANSATGIRNGRGGAEEGEDGTQNDGTRGLEDEVEIGNKKKKTAVPSMALDEKEEDEKEECDGVAPYISSKARVRGLYHQIDNLTAELATMQLELEMSRKSLKVSEVLTRSLRSSPLQGAVGQPMGPNNMPIGIVVIPTTPPPLAYPFSSSSSSGPTTSSAMNKWCYARPYPFAPREPLPLLLTTNAPLLQVRAWTVVETMRKAKEFFEVWATQNARTNRTVELHAAIAVHLLDTAAMASHGGLVAMGGGGPTSPRGGGADKGGGGGNHATNNGNSGGGGSACHSTVPNSTAEQMHTLVFNTNIWALNPLVATFRAILREEMGVWVWREQNNFIATHLVRLSRMCVGADSNTPNGGGVGNKRSADASSYSMMTFADLREALETALLAEGFSAPDVEATVRQFGRSYIPDTILREYRERNRQQQQQLQHNSRGGGGAVAKRNIASHSTTTTLMSPTSSSTRLLAHTIDEASIPVTIDATPYLSFFSPNPSATAAASSSSSSPLGGGDASGGSASKGLQPFAVGGMGVAGGGMLTRKDNNNAAADQQQASPSSAAGGGQFVSLGSGGAGGSGASASSQQLLMMSPSQALLAVENSAVLALRQLFLKRLESFYKAMDFEVIQSVSREDWFPSSASSPAAGNSGGKRWSSAAGGNASSSPSPPQSGGGGYNPRVSFVGGGNDNGGTSIMGFTSTGSSSNNTPVSRRRHSSVSGGGLLLGVSGRGATLASSGPQHPNPLGFSVNAINDTTNPLNSSSVGGGPTAAPPLNCINEAMALKCLRNVCQFPSTHPSNDPTLGAERFIKEVFRLCRAQHKLEIARLKEVGGYGVSGGNGSGGARAEYYNPSGMASHQVFLQGYTAHFFHFQYLHYPQLKTALDLVLAGQQGKGRGGKRGGGGAADRNKKSGGGGEGGALSMQSSMAMSSDASHHNHHNSTTGHSASASSGGIQYEQFATLAEQYGQQQQRGKGEGAPPGSPLIPAHGAPSYQQQYGNSGGGGGGAGNVATLQQFAQLIGEDLGGGRGGGGGDYVPLILFLRMYRKVPFVPFGVVSRQRGGRVATSVGAGVAFSSPEEDNGGGDDSDGDY